MVVSHLQSNGFAEVFHQSVQALDPALVDQRLIVQSFLNFTSVINLLTAALSLKESYGRLSIAAERTEARETINCTINHENGTISIPTINFGSAFFSP
jgi:predicted Zn-dependent protease